MGGSRDAEVIGNMPSVHGAHLAGAQQDFQRRVGGMAAITAVSDQRWTPRARYRMSLGVHRASSALAGLRPFWGAGAAAATTIGLPDHIVLASPGDDGKGFHWPLRKSYSRPMNGRVRA